MKLPGGEWKKRVSVPLTAELVCSQDLSVDGCVPAGLSGRGKEPECCLFCLCTQRDARLLLLKKKKKKSTWRASVWTGHQSFLPKEHGALLRPRVLEVWQGEGVIIPVPRNGAVLSTACSHLGNCLLMYEQYFIISMPSNTLKNRQVHFSCYYLVLCQSYRNRKQGRGFQDLKVRERLTTNMPRGILGGVGTVLSLEGTGGSPTFAFVKTWRTVY